MLTSIGEHIIIDFNTDDVDFLDSVERCEDLLHSLNDGLGLTKLFIKTHKFEPHGVTSVLVISESHISIHTWPECQYAGLDIFSCKVGMDLNMIVDILKERVHIKEFTVTTLRRGLEREERKE